MGKPTGFLEYQRHDCDIVPPSERIRNWNEFKLLPSREERVQQAARCMDCGVPFCQSGMMFGGAVTGCPLHNLIPEWNDLLYEGNWEQAWYRLRITNNFPEFTGRVCPAPCEKACCCGIHDEPVTCHTNELAIIENAFNKGFVKPRIPKVRTGKKVAVIGSGPSGLAAADLLNRRGHDVTVYERSDRPGGLLMYGIPNMKLDKHVVLRRIHLMEEEGVKFVYNADVGKNVSADQLKSDYDAVLLCCGARKARDMAVPGRDSEGIYFAVDYLTSNTKSLLNSNHTDGSYISAEGKNVLIIGGGDTGNDCVATAIRQGAAGVVQLEMTPKPPVERPSSNPWPQWPKVLKTDYGQEEAICVFGSDPRIFNATVDKFLADGSGKVCGANVVTLDWSEGSPKPVSSREIRCDLVLIAAGFTGCETYVPEAFGAGISARGRVDTAEGSFATNVPGVFTAGDMRRGASLVVWGIREGREAARQVDESLMGYTNLDEVG